MLVTRQGRLVVTSPEELNKWLGRESGEPMHVATPEADLAAELKRGLGMCGEKNIKLVREEKNR